MRAVTAIAAAGAFAQTAVAASVQAKNFIYVVPDGYGQSSQTMARDLKALVESGSPANRPGDIPPIAADELVSTIATSRTPLEKLRLTTRLG
jgi:alkaline phosphatase